jgi:vitamin B12 transporter
MRAATMGAAVVVVLASFAATARAATPDTATVRMPEVVVTGLRARDSLSRLPATATVFSRGDLSRLASPRLTTLLAGVPGLFAYRDGASGEPDVVDPRGFTANGETSYLKVLVDGHDVREIESGGIDWDWIGFESIERLEVIEGPGTWLYGDGAEGGLINIVRTPDGSARRIRSTVLGGSAGQRALGASIAGPRGLLRGAMREADGWRANSAESIRNAGGALTVPIRGPMRVELDGGWLDSDRRDPGTLTREQLDADPTQPETSTDFVHAKRLFGGARFVHSTSPDREISLGGSLRKDDVDQVRTIFEPLAHPSRGSEYGVDAEWRQPLETRHRLAFAAGAELEHATLDSRYFAWSNGARGDLLADDRAHRTTQAVHLNLRAVPWAGWTLRAGVRGDWLDVDARSAAMSRTMSAISPFVALDRALGARALAWASWGGAFHAPTLQQLFDQRFPGAVSNPRLDPQRSNSLELGARGATHAGGAWSAALYDIAVRDEIDFDLATFSYANIGRSRHRGAMVSFTQPLIAALAIEAGAAWTPTTIVGGANDGNQINAVPRGTATARLAWARPAGGLGAGVRAIGRQWLDEANQHPLAAVAVADLDGVLRLGHVDLAGRIANLFDRRYAESGFIGATGEERFLPAAGRMFTLSLAVR